MGTYFTNGNTITKIGQNTDIRLKFYVGNQDTNFKGQATLKSEPDW